MDIDTCASVVEAQHAHARGVNDCRSARIRRAPDGRFLHFDRNPKPKREPYTPGGNAPRIIVLPNGAVKVVQG